MKTHAIGQRPSNLHLLATVTIVAMLVASAAAMAAWPRSAAAVDFSLGDTAVVDADELNLRAAPGLDADIVAVLPVGTIATVTAGPETADDFNWYELELEDGATGWAASDFLLLLGAIDPGFAAGDAVVVAVGPLNLRADAALDADTVTAMPAGTLATVADGPISADGLPWYQLDAEDLGSGWSVGGFLAVSDGSETPAPGPAFPIGGALVVDGDGLNLRDAAGLDAAVVDLLPLGASATVLDGPVAADGYDWYQIETDLGTGWSAGAFLIDAGAPVPVTVAIGDQAQVVDGDLNLRADAGLDADILDVLPDGAALAVTDGPVELDGYSWFAVTSDDFGDGWVAGEFLGVVSSTEAAEAPAPEDDASTPGADAP